VVGQPVAHGRAAGLMDAFGIGTAGHGPEGSGET
jgi:hypothetical protein